MNSGYCLQNRQKGSATCQIYFLDTKYFSAYLGSVLEWRVAPMFARVKKSGNNQYLQIVENKKIDGKVVQRVISTVGRLDRLQEKGEVENLVRSLSRFSDKVLFVLSGKSEIGAEAKKIGPALIFERIWEQLGIRKILKSILAERWFFFDVERAIFLTVLHRLFVCGSDRL